MGTGHCRPPHPGPYGPEVGLGPLQQQRQPLARPLGASVLPRETLTHEAASGSQGKRQSATQSHSGLEAGACEPASRGRSDLE